jgi:hypothetical protein
VPHARALARLAGAWAWAYAQFLSFMSVIHVSHNTAVTGNRRLMRIMVVRSVQVHSLLVTVV